MHSLLILKISYSPVEVCHAFLQVPVVKFHLKIAAHGIVVKLIRGRSILPGRIAFTADGVSGPRTTLNTRDVRGVCVIWREMRLKTGWIYRCRIKVDIWQ